MKRLLIKKVASSGGFVKTKRFALTLLSGLGASALAFGGVSAGSFVSVKTVSSEDKLLKETNIIFSSVFPEGEEKVVEIRRASFVRDVIVSVVASLIAQLIDKVSSLYSKTDNINNKIEGISGSITSADPRQKLLTQLFHFRDEMELALRQIDGLKEIADDIAAEARKIKDRKLASEVLSSLRLVKTRLSFLKQDIFITITKINSLISEVHDLYR